MAEEEYTRPATIDDLKAVIQSLNKNNRLTEKMSLIVPTGVAHKKFQNCTFRQSIIAKPELRKEPSHET